MTCNFAIAIDGPVASGKSTVGPLVADALGAIAFDTGLLYRALAFQAVRREIDVDNSELLAEMAAELDLEIRPPTVEDGRHFDLILEGRDVTWELRSPEIDRALPAIAGSAHVRRGLLDQQRRIGRSGRVVLMGRDIGTVILPDAPFKFYLDAPVEERARRRYEELQERGVDISFEQVAQDLAQRDEADISRDISPLRPADDAIVIHTGEMEASDVAEQIRRIVEDRACGEAEVTKAGE